MVAHRSHKPDKSRIVTWPRNQTNRRVKRGLGKREFGYLKPEHAQSEAGAMRQNLHP